jgi:uncharacterized protein (DUF4415 family)
MKTKPENVSQKDWDDADIPELTDEDFARMHPASEISPDIVAAYQTGTLRRQGERGVQKAPTKHPVSIRLPVEVIEYFKRDGKGWQTRMSDALKAYVSSHST